jgi:hypothetical protein
MQDGQRSASNGRVSNLRNSGISEETTDEHDGIAEVAG